MAAARAGYAVAAFDIFNDVETRRFCVHSARVDFADGGFNGTDLLEKLDALGWDGAKLVYGSGLEREPQWIARMAERFALCGNDAATVASVKHPAQFFALLEHLGIPHPETRLEPPLDSGGWLVKQPGGSGGTHVRPWDHGMPSSGAGAYFQRAVDGMPVSLLFAADGKDIEAIGYNLQWCAPAPGMPFRYGGAVGNADLPAHIRAAMREAARKVAAAFGLRGLNSMDFVLSGKLPLALEVNPRLSASFALYDRPQTNLLELHLGACRGELNPFLSASTSCAHLVHYAERDLVPEETFAWPSWTADLPLPGTHCRAGEPLCSIYAEAADAAAARALVFARARELDAQLQTF